MKNTPLALLIFLTINVSLAETWKLDARFASLDIVKMVKQDYPQLSDKAELISHYSGYYSINPFVLSEYLLIDRVDVDETANLISMTLKQNKRLNKSINLKHIHALRSKYKLTNQKQKANSDNMPALDLPYDHTRGWFFGGVHTWTGDNNGSPMSSIDLARSWNSNWGDDLTGDWVAAAHDGIVTRYSSCFIRITHSSGWATDYYHLDNTQFNTGDEVRAGDKISNYADTLAQAICQGGHSQGPHVHFALVKDGERYALHDVELSKWKIHPGTSSYDYSTQRMWLIKNGVKKYAFQNTVSHLNGDNEIDYRYTGIFSSPEISGHGINVVITQRPIDNSEEVRNIVLVAFYTYDDNGNANFYVGNIDFDNWRIDEYKTIPLLQTSGGNFINLQTIDFENDVIEAGNMSIHYTNCSQIEVSFSLTEPVNNEVVSHELVLTKSVGIPEHVCEAPSI